jgi:hypothetical protein
MFNTVSLSSFSEMIRERYNPAETSMQLLYE